MKKENGCDSRSMEGKQTQGIMKTGARNFSSLVHSSLDELGISEQHTLKIPYQNENEWQEEEGEFLAPSKGKSLSSTSSFFFFHHSHFLQEQLCLWESHTIPVSLSYRAKHDTQGDDEGVPSREVHTEKETHT